MIQKEIYYVSADTDHRLLVELLFHEFLKSYKIRFFLTTEDLYKYMVRASSPAYRGALPHLLLLDLPLQTGYDSLLKLVRHKLEDSPVAWHLLPVVVLVREAADQQIRDCYSAGASSVLARPERFAELKDLLLLICHYWTECNELHL